MIRISPALYGYNTSYITIYHIQNYHSNRLVGIFFDHKIFKTK